MVAFRRTAGSGFIPQVGTALQGRGTGKAVARHLRDGGRVTGLPEWQEASNSHVDQSRLVPGLGWDLAGDVLGATGCIEGAGVVLAEDAADDGEGEAHEQPHGQQQQDGGGRQGLC